MTEALRLFLIEDEDDVALLIRRSLERAGHQVTRCRNAADALIVLGHTSFDLALVDQRLPDMLGMDLLHLLAHEGIGVPALLVTAYGDEHLATRALQAGALDYVVKDQGLAFLGELPKRVAESVTRHRLVQMNRLLVQALESARDGILITDLQGTILSVNQALERLTGYSRQELLGKNPRIFNSGLHSAEVYAEMWRTILARGSWQGELTNKRKDGSLRQVSITISPIVDAQGRLTHFVGIQRDVTEHKQLERQLLQAQKMQSVGTLAGGVAHEFNNLLAGINGYAALGLRELGLTATLREFLHNVVALSERAAMLTRQLLAFARKPALSRKRSAIGELVCSTADLVKRSLHVEVTLEVDDRASMGGPLLVEADANQLQQALVNLALNARDALRDATARGEAPPEAVAAAAIRFRLRQLLLTTELPAFPQNVPPGDYVLLEVEDQGCGMSTDVLNQSLDPFFTTKEVGQGTGLGLPMVFGIVQGHQGHLTIDSRPEHGTTVRIYLPRLVESADLDQPSILTPGADVSEPELVKGRDIIVVDDEDAVLDVVRRFLQIAGHHVRTASSGHDALEMLSQREPVDLVILDLMMPREDAFITFQKFRQRRPGVPVLLCTGLPQADPAPALLRHPGVSLIRKPFRMNELWSAVKQALGG
jgi:two-component system, cell cycle sensor histidine kinase and response regulator CckA